MPRYWSRSVALALSLSAGASLDASLLGNRQAPAIKGSMSAEAAMSQALVGSGYALRVTDSGHFSVQRVASGALEVGVTTIDSVTYLGNPRLTLVSLKYTFCRAGALFGDQGARQVLLVRHLLQPLDILAIEHFGHGQVRHGGGGRRAVPVAFAAGTRNNVACADFGARATFTLGPTHAAEHHQRLPQRVRVPGGAGAGFEGDDGAAQAGGLCGLERAVDAHRAGEPGFRAFDGRLGAAADDGLGRLGHGVIL